MRLLGNNCSADISVPAVVIAGAKVTDIGTSAAWESPLQLASEVRYRVHLES